MVRLAKPSERPSGRLREKARSKLRFVLESASTLARGASLGHPRASCAPRGPALDLQDRRAPPGSPTMPQGGSAAQIFDLGKWAAWPRRISGVRNAPRRRAAASPRRRRCRPRRRVSRKDNLLLFDAGRDRVSRRAASRNSSYQRETQGRPRRFASTPPRARTGHPILATCEARDRAPRVPTGQASVSRRIRRGRLRAVLDSLARGESLA